METLGKIWYKKLSSFITCPFRHFLATHIDTYYTKMGLLHALFWSLGIVLTIDQHLTLAAGPASRHCHTQIMSLYGHSWFNSQRRRAAPPLLFLSVGMLFICGYTTDLAGEAFVFSPVTREFILKLFPVLCQWKTCCGKNLFDIFSSLT